MMRINRLDTAVRFGARGALGRRGALAWLAWLAWLVAAAGLLATSPRAAEAASRRTTSGDDDASSSRDRGGDGGDPDERDPVNRGPDAHGLDDGDPAAAAAVPPLAPAAPIAGPSVGEVLAQAYRAAGLDRSPARGLARRARLAGLIPSVTVRAGRNTRWQDADPDVDRGVAVEARASWRLDRLLFDGRELQIASAEAARRRERRQLAGRVIRAYFHWQRTAGAAAASPRWASRAEEAAAELDAFTDGWFSGQLARDRPRAPARRR
jgi:hypothetical protein